MCQQSHRINNTIRRVFAYQAVKMIDADLILNLHKHHKAELESWRLEKYHEVFF